MGRYRVACLLPFLTVAIVSPALAERLPLHHYGVADGLPTDKINALLADSRGFLWVGTSDGLSRFDGYEFVTYGQRDGLSSTRISDIRETRDGRIWVGTDAGLCRFDPKPPRKPDGLRGPLFVCASVSDDLWAAGATVIRQAAAGHLWIGTGNGLFRARGDSERVEISRIDLPSQKPLSLGKLVRALAEDRQGELWIGLDFSLVRMSPDGRVIVQPTVKRRDAQGVSDIMVDRAGGVWIAASRDIFHLAHPIPFPAQGATPSSLEALAREPALSGVRRYPKPERLSWAGHLLETHDGRILLNNEEYCAIEAEKLSCRTLDDSGGRQSVPRIAVEDREGNVWIGTESSGLLRLVSSGLVRLGLEDGLTQARIASIVESQRGELHVVMSDGNLARWTGSRFIVTKPNLPSHVRYLGWGWNQVHMQDSRGEWWIPTGEGLARFPAVRNTEELAEVEPRHFYTSRDGLIANDIFRLFEDSRGDIWIVTVGGDAPEQLHRWERAKDRIVRYRLRGHFDVNGPTAFAEDRAGELWIGLSEGGMVRFKDGVFEQFPPGVDVPEGRVGDLLLDSRGRLWVATAGGGVLVAEEPGALRPVFRAFTTSDGLASNRVHCLAEDSSGRIYIGSVRGVDRLDPDSGRIRHYSESDGLPNSEVHLARRDRHGDIWFGSLTGLARLRPSLDVNSTPPTVLIRRLRLAGVEQPVSELGESEITGLEMKADQRHVEIGFAGLAAGPSEAIRYQHRLLGLSADWSLPAAERTVQIAGLSAGRYRFEVRGVGADGQLSAAAAAVAFRVMPPFWRAWWFIALALAAFAAAVFAIHRARVSRLLELERVRTRIATDLHDDLGSSLSRISILSELARRQAPRGDGGTDRLLAEVGSSARGLIDAASDIVWSIDPRQDDLGSLVARLRELAADLFDGTGVAWRFDAPDTAGQLRLPPERRRHLYLILKEAMHNIVKHARASSVALSIHIEDRRIVADVWDDGIGFDPDQRDGPRGSGRGRGLTSMESRARQAGGALTVRSAPGSGVKITVALPAG